MLVFSRLYRFHRRCGMTRRHAFHRALTAVMRDFNLTRSNDK